MGYKRYLKFVGNSTSFLRAFIPRKDLTHGSVIRFHLLDLPALELIEYVIEESPVVS